MSVKMSLMMENAAYDRRLGQTQNILNLARLIVAEIIALLHLLPPVG